MLPDRVSRLFRPSGRHLRPDWVSFFPLGWAHGFSARAVSRLFQTVSNTSVGQVGDCLKIQDISSTYITTDCYTHPGRARRTDGGAADLVIPGSTCKTLIEPSDLSAHVVRVNGTMERATMPCAEHLAGAQNVPPQRLRMHLREAAAVGGSLPCITFLDCNPRCNSIDNEPNNRKTL